MPYDLSLFEIRVGYIEEAASNYDLRLLNLLKILKLTGCRPQDFYNNDGFMLLQYPTVKLVPSKNNLIRTFNDPLLYSEIEWFNQWKDDVELHWNYKKLYRYLRNFIPTSLDLWLGKDTVTYMYRFAFVQRLLNEGKTHTEIQNALGHKHLASTMEYISKLI
jgi:integrase